ncbi:hypothetical protein EGW08_003457 [Elysia chlorotica]|uniref:C2H2-type domain-containing protein n=1 Tax=Elysia chlorotica TaxID=188477 RepID=A0A3S1A286_ELYCH|nr:hypothetical protein EGW08_003457 [Elysia chlorotica]
MMNTDYRFQSMQKPAQEVGKDMGSANLSLLQMRAKAFHKATLELLPHVESFESEASKVTPLLLSLDHHKQLVKQLLDHLQTLLSEVFNMELKLTGMMGVMKTILTDNCAKNPIVLDTPTFKVEDADAPEDSMELPEQSEDMMAGNTQSSDFQSVPGVETTLGEQQATMLPSSAQTWTKGSSSVIISGEKVQRPSQHMQKYHQGENTFPCKLCPMVFDKYLLFQSYLTSHKASTEYKCDLCNRTLKSRPGIAQHVISHMEETLFTCGVCGKRFKDKQSAATCTHMEGRSDLLNYQCGFQCKNCGEYFATLEDLKKSSSGNASKLLISTEGEDNLCMHNDFIKRYYCFFCPKAYCQARTLRQHLKIHKGVQLYKCDLCGEKFFTKIEKNKHVYEKHSGEFPGRKCKICGLMCRSGLGRETHYMNHTPEERSMHNIVIKMSECDVCGKTVRTNKLTSHKLQHSSEGSFICEFCGKGFKHSKGLKRHVLLHMKPEERPPKRARLSQEFKLPLKSQPAQKISKKPERKYRCDICSNFFFSRQGLQYHQFVHTKEKNFKCDFCELSFTHPSNLKRHFRIHTGQKSFQCDICGKSFVQKNGMVAHRRTHTGEKPYQCNHCGKRFSDPSTLYKHRSKHEKDASYGSYHLQSL